MSQIKIQGAEVMPPMGGWGVNIDIKGQDFRFQGGPHRIVQQIRSMQKKNGVYLGDDEIWEYCNDIWCENDPARCLKSVSQTKVGMRSRVLTFATALKALVKNGLQPVSLDLATDRAKICRHCPKNRAIESCSDCLKATALITKGLLGRRKTRYDRRLRACSVCGCDLKQKVHYPLNVDDKNEYPAYCWVAKEKKKV